ncbi:MAG: hypothetical protein CEE43_04290 [Promethearchaeota archaeon Loki_b32]|nr:MAG: hypothetical protein CEE43_04290 [Candidatus Lokiarchaeota archaeon Loki_b32]
MVKNIIKLVIDGEEHSFSEDHKNFIGPKKKYTIKEFQEEKLKSIKNFVALREGTVFGFSDEEEFDKWLVKKNLYEEHNKHKKRLKKVLETKRPSEEWEKINQNLIKEEKKATTRFKNFLKKHNLEPGQHELIREKIKEDFDPYLPPKLNTMYLYEHIFYGGSFISLKGGYIYCGKNYPKYYPDLRNFNFNDKTSSVDFNCGSRAYVYEHINFGGNSVWLWGPYYPFLLFVGLDNKISSAVVYG